MAKLFKNKPINLQKKSIKKLGRVGYRYSHCFPTGKGGAKCDAKYCFTVFY